MSTETTKPKPRPRSVEEWREKRKKRYGNGGDNGGFRILPRKVLDSDAFNELSKSAKLVLILSLDQLDYWLKKKHKGQPKRDSTVGLCVMTGAFPCRTTCSRNVESMARIPLPSLRENSWQQDSGRPSKQEPLQQSGVFRWSDNWVTYNQRSIHDRMSMATHAKAPGYCHYPNIERYNEARQARSTDLQYSEIINAQKDDAINPEPEFLVQLELFAELAA